MRRFIWGFIVSYASVLAALWGLVEAYTYFKGESLRDMLGNYWILFYILPTFPSFVIAGVNTKQPAKKTSSTIAEEEKSIINQFRGKVTKSTIRIYNYYGRKKTSLDKMGGYLTDEEYAKQRIAKNDPKPLGTNIAAGGRRTTKSILIRSKYFQRLVEDHQDYRIEGFKTRGPFVLGLEKVFVPLRLFPQSPERITSDMFEKSIHANEISVWDLLRKSEKAKFRSIAIIGPPGSGKTTLLRHLTLIYARNLQYRYQKHDYKYSRFRSLHRVEYWIQKILFRLPHNNPSLVPVFVLLRDHAEAIVSNPELTLSNILQTIHSSIIGDYREWFDFQLSKGNCLVLFDGLDEVGDAARRKKVGDWVNNQMRSNPHSRFILTSRPFGYRDIPVDQIRIVVEIRRFNRREIDQFIENWYLQNEILRRLGRNDQGVQREASLHAEDLKKRIRGHQALSLLAVNPLLLTMIAIVHDNRGALPGRRVELYEEICDVMLGRRQEAKGLPSVLSAAQSKRVLQVLALELMKAKLRTFDIRNASLYMRKRLGRVAGPELQAEEFIRHVEEFSGLLVERETNKFEFSHKSFQEYLASVEVKESGQEQILIDNLSENWWEETIRLFAVQASNTNRLFQSMLLANTIQGLALAYECLNEGAEISLKIRQELKNRIDVALESTDLSAAKPAAQVLLAQRLKHLNRIDDGLFIDEGYVSCAEYQLFLDSTQNSHIKLQPDTWAKQRFVPGTGRHPITGIRASDAQDFCNWINLEYHEEGFIFRLPRADEIKLLSLTKENIGCWCRADKVVSLEGLNESFLQKQVEFIVSRLIDVNPIFKNQLDLHDVVKNFLLRFDEHDSLMRFADIFIELIARARKIFEDPKAQLSLRELTQRYMMLDGAISPTYVAEIAEVFSKARNMEEVLKLATELDRIYGFDFVISLITQVKLILERNLDRDLEMDLVSIHELIKKGSIIIPKVVPLWDLSIDKLYLFILVATERRKGNLPSWEGLRIVKQKDEFIY